MIYSKPRAPFQHRLKNGVIVPLAAIMLGVMLALVGLGFYIVGYGASTEMARNASKLIVLGALEAYMGKSCDPQDPVEECHADKMAAALERASLIAERNTGGLSDVTFVAEQGVPNSPGETASLTPLKWYTAPPASSDPCSGEYPCGVPTSASELANALRLEGSVTDKLGSMLSLGILGLDGPSDVVFRTTAVASPMHVVFVVDLSSSVAEDSHLTPQAAALRSQSDPDMKTRSGDFWGSFFAYNALLTGKFKGSSLKGATREQFTAHDEGSAVVADVWSETLAQQGRDKSENPPTPYDHFFDDYRIVYAFAETAKGREFYDALYRSLHPEVDGTQIVERETPLVSDDGDAVPILLDRYRDETHYSGPQPLTTILQGVRTFINRMEARQVAGDKAGLVFVDDRLTWNRVINLTSNIPYLNSVLDIDNGASDNSPYDPEQVIEPESVFSNPRWQQLQLFPLPNRNTDLFSALTMAATQLATDGNIDAPPGDLAEVVPSVDLVVLFTDGLGNCAPQNGMSVCNNNYAGYLSSKTAIDNLAYNSFFKTKTPLHVIMAGQQSGPNLVLNPLTVEEGSKTKSTVFRCQTEEEVRKQADDGLRSVVDTTCTTPSLCQIAWAERFTTPFTIAVKDWYDVAVRTGGVFFPLLPTPPKCAAEELKEACALGNSRTFFTDPLCRSPAQQVQAALDQILKNSHAFTIVEAK